MTEAPHLALTRSAYDTVAVSYLQGQRDSLDTRPVERAVLAAFAELVLAGGGGAVADVGCGPGHVTAHLRSLGLDAVGVDLSPEMVAVARAAHPGLRFEVGSMAALDLPDAALAGVVARYSIIHTPPSLRPVVLAELGRVLMPGGRLLLAFQVGDDEVIHVESAYGHAVSCDAYRCSPRRVSEQLREAGFTVDATVIQEPGPQERTQQAFILSHATQMS
jgi:SAM-dependent methyltransferase